MKSFLTNKPTKLLLHLLFIFSLSCSSAPKEEEKKVAWDQWKNHSKLPDFGGERIKNFRLD